MLTTGQSYHIALVWDEAANTLTGYLDGEYQGSVAGNELNTAGSLVTFGNFNHSGAGTGRGLNGELYVVSFSTYTGAFNPEEDFILLVAPPVPANNELLVPIQTDGDPGTETLTTLSWEFPAYTFVPSAYDVYFGYYPDNTEPNALLPYYGLTKLTTTPITDSFIDPSPSGNLQNSTLTETLPNYYWMVVAYEPNEPEAVLHSGPLWRFTTTPAAAVIQTDPASKTVAAGSTAVFTVTAVNAEIYQWYKDGTALTEAPALYSGEKTASLTVYDVQLDDEGFYSCVIDNSLNLPDTSEKAQLLTQRLVGWWKLDGNLTDSVATAVPGAVSHDGTSPNPDLTGIGKDGGALSLPGTVDGLVTISNSADFFNFYPQGYSASAWVNMSAKTTAWGAYVAKQGSDPARGFILTHNNTGKAVHTLRQMSPNDLPTSVDIDDNTWHLVTGTYDAATKVSKVYVDGVLRNQVSYTGTPTGSPAELIFGAELPNGNVPYIGLLDDVHIWSYPLDSASAALLYTDFNPGTSICSDYSYYDVAGPGGIGTAYRDCRVTLYDFVPFADVWLECNIVPDCIP